MAVLSGGLTTLVAPETLTASNKEFDHKFYNQVMKNNKANFDELYKKYQAYNNIYQDGEKQEKALYKKRFDKQNKHIKYKDKSGLIGRSKPCNINFNTGNGYAYILPKTSFSSDVNLNLYKQEVSKSVRQYKTLLNDKKRISGLKKNIQVYCDNRAINNSEFTVLSTNVTKAKNGVNLYAKVLIKKVKPKLLAPKTYTLKDRSLSVKFKFDGQNLSIKYTNHTNKYLKVKNISSYVQREIKTHSVELELPPKGYVTRNYSAENIFAYNEYGTSNYNLVKSNLVTKRLQYGWAVKYKFIDTSKEHTIYNTKTYNLFSLYKSLYM